MIKKRIVSFITAFAMTLTLCLSIVNTSLAAADISVSATPDELTEAGNVDITVEIENNYGAPMNITSIQIGSSTDTVSETISPADGPYTYKKNDFYVSSSQLGNPLTIKVNYSVGTDNYSDTDTITIAKKVVEPEVSLTRVCNMSSQLVGDPVEFTYTVKNLGTEKIENVVLHDSYQDSALNSAFSLNSGQSKTFDVIHTMEGTVASRPSVSFTCSGQNFIETIDTLYVTAQDEALLVDLSASATSGNVDDEITLSCKVTNQSGQKISNISVEDEKGDSFGSTFSLNAGSSKTVSKTIKLSESRDVKAIVTGLSKSGNKVSSSSDVVSIEVDSGEDSEGLGLSVKPDRSQLEEGGGEVEFEITVSNTRSNKLKDVVITEETLGEITTIDVLSTGDKLILKTFELTENQTFAFSATATDDDGNTYNITAESVEILVGPQDSPMATEGADQQGGSVSGLLVVVIIIIVLAIIVGVVLLVLVRKEKKEKKLVEEAEQAEQVDAIYQDGSEDSEEVADSVDEYYNDEESVVPPEIEQDEFEDVGEIDDVDDIDNAKNDIDPEK